MGFSPKILRSKSRKIPGFFKNTQDFGKSKKSENSKKNVKNPGNKKCKKNEQSPCCTMAGANVQFMGHTDWLER